MQKEYIEPVFQFIKTEEENKVFYAGSGGPTPAGSLHSSTIHSGSWS